MRTITEPHIPISMYGESPEVLSRYRELVRNGMQPGLASIVSTRSSPALGTDTQRTAGVGHQEQHFGKEYMKLRRAEARKAGIAVSDNSTYYCQLAGDKRGGDPNAWTQAGDGPSALKRRLQEMGGNCEELGVKHDSSRTAENMAKKKKTYIDRMKRQYEASAVVHEKKQKQRS